MSRPADYQLSPHFLFRPGVPTPNPLPSRKTRTAKKVSSPVERPRRSTGDDTFLAVLTLEKFLPSVSVPMGHSGEKEIFQGPTVAEYDHETGFLTIPFNIGRVNVSTVSYQRYLGPLKKCHHQLSAPGVQLVMTLF